jgi:hypothetical protein
MTPLHTNHEIDALIETRLPLIRRAAGRVCRHREDELTHEIVYLWWSRYVKNPSKWWGILADPCPAHVVANCRQMALRVLEGWQRDEREFEAVWGRADTDALYAGGVGAREVGGHIASEGELRGLFEAVERYAAGEVEALDLWTAYRRAEQVAQEAIRYLASGYSREEIGSKSAYNAAKKCLQGALR